jgi:hypothetical protein
MRWKKVLGVGTLAGLFLTGATATARLDAAPTAGRSLAREGFSQASAAPAAETWNTFSADITIRHSRVQADGRPAGGATPAMRYHWERRLTGTGWKSTMTFENETPVSVQSPGGHKQIENPFAIARIEDDEDGTPLRLFDRKGERVHVPSELQLRRQFNREPGPLVANETALASAVRPRTFGREWSETILAMPSKAAARRAALERRFGRAAGRIRALDRFVSTHDQDTTEVLADPQSALPLEINVVRNQALLSHTTMGYVRGEGGALIRRSLRIERAIPDTAGERTATDVEINNVHLEEKR